MPINPITGLILTILLWGGLMYGNMWYNKRLRQKEIALMQSILQQQYVDRYTATLLRLAEVEEENTDLRYRLAVGPPHSDDV